MTKRKYVDVNVSWCYGDCSPTAKLSLDEWQAILRGEEIGTDVRYGYEGKKYTAIFLFNVEGPGTLRVTYDDGGVGFEGRISEATITGGSYPDDRDAHESEPD